MTGLLGGGHAIYFDAASGTARNLDCFCAVPGLGAPARESELLHLDVPFGAEVVHYAVGPASCAVPGVPAGLGALWEAHGRLPWARLVEPALRLARDGVAMPAAHVACLAMLEPVMTLREGARMYAPGRQAARGRRAARAARARRAHSSLLAAEGAAGAYTGTIGAALLELCRTSAAALAHRATTSPRTRRSGASRSRRRGSACGSSRAAGSPACRRARAAAAPARALAGRAASSRSSTRSTAARARRRTRRISSRSTRTATRAC